MSFAAFALFLPACCGWGHILARWAAGNEWKSFAFLSVVGIACLTFLGGVLNLFRLAVPVALDLLLLSGLAFCAIWARDRLAVRRTGPASAGMTIYGYLPPAVLVLATGFYAWTLLPATAYNISDDFYTYVLRPVRMLQTGTLGGNPYEMLGLDSLGANAFLQAFVLLGFPLQYLLGFDAVFSFALAGMLLLALGRKLGLHWVYTLFAMLAFVVINPQSVNISAIYISAALILGIIYASCELLEQIDAAAGVRQKLSALALGLLFACLIGLKVTFVAYSMVYFATFFAGLLWLTPEREKVLKLCGLTLASTLLALLPWLALFAGNYAAAIRLALHPAAGAIDSGFSVPRGNVAMMFSTADLFYGGSFLSYGFIVLSLLLLAHALAGGKATPAGRRFPLIAAAACLAGVISYLFNGLIFNPELAVRYSCPVLVASFPFALLAAASALPDPARLSEVKPLALLALPVVLVLLFWNDFLVRIERIHTRHESIAFDLNEGYLSYNQYVFSAASREAIRALQYRTEPGQRIFAWVSMPMHLDFARNDIYTLREPALVDPWLDVPYTGNAGDLVHYLKGQGVRYVLWEFNGYGMPTEDKMRKMLSFPYQVYRKIGQRSLYLRKVLALLAQGGAAVAQTENYVLLDLQLVRD
jgi:hypothetical protein